MRAHRTDDSLLHFRGRDLASVSECAIQQEPLDARWVARRKRERRRTTPRGAQEADPPEPEVVDQRGQQRHAALKREVLVAHQPVRETHPELVIANEREAARQGVPEATDALVAPVELEMTDPPRG